MLIKPRVKCNYGQTNLFSFKTSESPSFSRDTRGSEVMNFHKTYIITFMQDSIYMLYARTNQTSEIGQLD